MCLPTTLDNRIDIEAASALPLDDDNESQIPDHVEIAEEKICYLESSEQSKKNGIYKARALVLLVATLYGSNFPLVKMMGENSPLSVGMTCTLRFGLAAIVTSPWLFSNFIQIIRQWSTSPEAAAMIAGFEAGLWNFIGFTAQAVGLQTISASKSAFFCSMAVIVVPPLDFFFKGHKMRWNQIAGLVLAIVGVGVLGLVGMNLETGSLLSRGDLISMVQAVGFGVVLWRMEAAMQKYPDHALRASAAQQFAVFFGSAVYATFSSSGGLDISQLHSLVNDPWMLGSLLWTGIVTTALAKYMETVAMKTISASETTLFLLTEPISGSLFAAVLIGERLGLNEMIGSGLILVSCITSTSGFDKLQSFCKKDRETMIKELDDEGTDHFSDA